MDIVGVVIGSIAGVFVVVFGGRGLVDLVRSYRERRAMRPAPGPRPEVLESENDSFSERQEVLFATARDGVRIAYAITGSGPLLVRVPTFTSHLQFEWASPVWRPWWTTFAAHNTLVRFDQRGCGLSDWEIDDFSFEARVADLEAVVDAANLERVALLAMSQGGPVAVEYTARHPDRVTHLILMGTFGRGWRARGDAAAQREALYELMREGWGQDNPAFRQVWTARMIPDGSYEQIQSLNEMQRVATTGENAARLSSSLADVDLLSTASRIQVPTLVFHSRQDAMIRFDHGRELAARIPGARFVPLESKNHVILVGEPAWNLFINEVTSFLQTTPNAPTA